MDLHQNQAQFLLDGETTTKAFTDIPHSDPIPILLGKVDKTTNANKPQGSTSLKDAQFTIYCDYECHHY